MRLDNAADRESIEAALASLDLPGAGHPAGLLAVFLAGPLRPVPGHPGWWSPRPADLLAETDGLLRRDGGVHHGEALRHDIVDIGVPSGLADAWLGRQPIRRQDDLIVSLAGRPADVAVRALEAMGQAMSSQEL